MLMLNRISLITEEKLKTNWNLNKSLKRKGSLLFTREISIKNKDTA